MNVIRAVIGNNVSVTAKPNDLFHDFSGYIIGFKDNFIQVIDQDNDIWDCDADQVELEIG